MTLRDSREMNYDSKLQNMSWFCYNLWTRCPRQAWPHGSLTTKHYRVLVGNHHRGYWSLVHDLELAQQAHFPRANQSVAWCARDTYRMKVASLQTTEYFAHVYDWLGMIPKEVKQAFSNSWRQLASSAHELEGLTSFVQTYASRMSHEDNAYKSFQY